MVIDNYSVLNIEAFMVNTRTNSMSVLIGGKRGKLTFMKLSFEEEQSR